MTNTFGDFLNNLYGIPASDIGSTQAAPVSTPTTSTPPASSSGSSGSSGSSWLSSLGSLLGTASTAASNGASLYQKLTGNAPSGANAASKNAAANSSTASATLIKWLPWIIGGGVGLVLLVVLIGRRR